uniref:Ubiquitin-like domain-containing protein n=1 Tax=Cyprinodon variegatus TaxID=28743 RepID=A0A3Q2GBM7_CYPVA
MIYQVVVKSTEGHEITIDLCDTEEQMQRITVGQLTEKIVERLPYTEDECRLLFVGRQLELTKLLSEYGIQNNSCIHLVRRLRGGCHPPSSTDDGLGDKEGETRRSKEFSLPPKCLLLQ